MKVHGGLVALLVLAASACGSGGNGTGGEGGTGTGTTSTGGDGGGCPSGEGLCGDACVDLQSNAEHCGACGTTCSGVTGACCGGGCVDTQTDVANCGQCGNACPADAPCVDGVCVCMDATVLGFIGCGGTCVDPKTDPQNCGHCGRSCDGTTCMFSQCQPITLASNQAKPYGLAIDGQNAYFTNNFSPGDVLKAPIAGGGTATQLAAGGLPSYVAVDATHVYFTDGLGGTVSRVPIAGGAPVPIAPGQLAPQGVAVDATNVYWTNKGNGGVLKAPKAGGTPTPIAMEQGGPLAITVDAANVYWTNSNVGEVMKAPIAGGAPVKLATVPMSMGQLPFIVVDAKDVYFTANSVTDGAVMKVPIAGGDVVTLAAKQQGASGVAVDATGVYWAALAGQIYRLAPGSNTPEVLSSGLLNPLAVVLDKDWVYFTSSYGGGTVQKVPK